MKSAIVFIFFISFSLLSFGQKESSSDEQRLKFGLHMGANFTKFRDVNYHMKYGTKPFIGFYTDVRFFEPLYLNVSIAFSRRASVHRKPAINLSASYIDYCLAPKVRIGKDFYLHAGICYSSFIDSLPFYDGVNDPIKAQYGGESQFDSELNIMTGLEVRLGRLVNLQFNYLIPTTKINSINYQLGLKFFLNNRKNNGDKNPNWDSSPYTTDIVHSEEDGLVYPSYVEKAPVFGTGLTDLYMHLQDNVRVYPRDTRVFHDHTACNIYVLTILETGEVKDVELYTAVAEYAHYSYEAKFLEEEIRRVIEEMPNWNPAKLNGEAVSLKIYLPLKFIVYYGKIEMRSSKYVFPFDGRD